MSVWQVRVNDDVDKIFVAPLICVLTTAPEIVVWVQLEQPCQMGDSPVEVNDSIISAAPVVEENAVASEPMNT